MAGPRRRWCHGYMSSEVKVASASRVIAAPAAAIFELVADPSRQPEWDGNDNLAHADPGQRVTSAGEVFVMTNAGGNVRENTVVDFEEGRRIAWRPNPPGEPAPGHEWRWAFEPIDETHTQVTHTYDWTGLDPHSRPSRLERARATTPDRLKASLDRLAELAER
jgi:uncharacterized protein YndB with AHSA1/START domain